MPGVGELTQLTKVFGLPIALLLCAVVVLWRENQRLHALQKDLLDQRGKYLDSILSEAINAKSPRRDS